MDLKSGYPYSLIRNGLVNNFPKLTENRETEAVIIGGGISGALTAYYLIKSGISCILIDGRSIGLGSTCASTSLLQYEIDIALHKLIDLIGQKNAVKAYRLCSESIYKLFSISEEIGFSDIQAKHSLYFADNKKHNAFLRKEFQVRKINGFSVSLLKEDEVYKQTGVKAPSAILSENAAQTDAYLFTHQLHKHNQHKGLEIYDRTKVMKINSRKDDVVVEMENETTIIAKWVINATGYEVTSFIKKPIVKLKSTYAIISEAMNGKPGIWNDEMILWNTNDPYLYLRTTSDNRVMIGGRDEDFYSPAKRDKLLSKKSKQLASDFNKLFSGEGFVPEFSWAGTFGSTKDGLPYIGSCGDDKRILYALGFGGNGITFSVIAGEIIADLVQDKKNEDAELFSFSR